MFDDCMREKIVIERPTVTNKYAEYSFISELIFCRLEMVEKIIRSQEGTNITSVGQMYSRTKLQREDKFKYDDVEYKIEKVIELKDITGKIQHYVGYIV